MPDVSRHFGYPIQAAVLGVCNSVLQLAQAFGVRLNGDQDAAVTALMNAVWVLAMAVVAVQKNGQAQP